MEVLTWHQIAARLAFTAGAALIFFFMGPLAVAGAGMMLLLLLVCREIEARGRVAQPHWQPDQQQYPSRD